MSRANLAGELRNSLVEEPLVFISDIKDMIATFGPALLWLVAHDEAQVVRGDFPPDEAVAVRRVCKILREQFANAERETMRFEAALKVSAPRDGYAYLLEEGA